jgi:hypothetical protein
VVLAERREFVHRFSVATFTLPRYTHFVTNIWRYEFSCYFLQFLFSESLPASIACHILPLLLCRELQFVGSPLETNIYSRFLCQGYEKSGSIELPSSCLDILDRAFNSRVLPEAASFLLIDAFARLDGPQSPVLPATENLLGKLARLWRDSEFSSHATVQHHRHISVSLLYALRRLCQSQTPFFESSAARSSAQDVPRSPAQLANWAAESEDDSDLKVILSIFDSINSIKSISQFLFTDWFLQPQSPFAFVRLSASPVIRSRRRYFRRCFHATAESSTRLQEIGNAGSTSHLIPTNRNFGFC